MGKILRHIVPMVIIAMLIVSCGRDRSTIETLTRVESIMQEHPDSALSLLQAIDTEAIATDRCRALHSLLLSQAYDKNYIDLTSDSLISIAVNYYTDTDDHHHAMLAHYYRGRIFENTHKYHKAIIEFTKAEQLAKYSDDNLAIGLIYTHLGDAYNEYYDFEKSAKSFLIASEYYDRANKLHHKLYALSDLTEAYINNLEYDKASEILNQLIKEANDSCNHAMIQIGMLDLISLYSAQNKHSELLDLYNSLIAKYPNVKLRSTTYMCVAKACAYAGRHNEINSYISKAWNVSMHRADTILIQINASAIYELLKQYEPALKSLKYGGIKQDSSVRVMLTQPILTAQRDLYRAELELNKTQKENLTLKFMLAITIAVIIILIGIYLITKYIRRKREEIREYLHTIATLRDSIENNHTHNTQMSILTNNLFSEQFSLIGNIGKSIAELQDDKVGLKLLYNKINTIISKFEEPETLSKLEDIINRCKDNLMLKLRTEMPKLNKKEYQQMCYHYVGFPINLIGYLMHEKNTTIYKRRERIKNKIIKDSPVHAGEFISF